MKAFRLSASEIRQVATGRGSCIASDEITVGGKPVGFMYRQQPDNEHDSGWRFFSGGESQEFADNSANFEIYDVNTIANYDRSIVALLWAPVGSAYGRNERGEFVPEPFPGQSDV